MTYYNEEQRENIRKEIEEFNKLYFFMNSMDIFPETFKEIMEWAKIHYSVQGQLCSASKCMDNYLKYRQQKEEDSNAETV